jgi:chorismate mutase
MSHTDTTDTAATDTATPDDAIAALRGDIDEVDAELVRLWRRRAELSRTIGARRVAAGGTRLALGREQVVVDRFARALGESGVQLALLLLKAGRGPL